MLQAYSLNVTAAANSAIPFNNVTIEKGTTAILSAPGTINLNKAGVYMVSADASSATAATIQLSKDGVLQPQATSTGTSPSFTTLVQVSRNNCNCNCITSPVVLRLANPTAAAETFTDANIVVTKVC